MGRQNGRPTELAPDLEEVLGLSDAAARFVRSHPAKARLAVKVALETAAAELGIEPAEKALIPDALKPFVVEREQRPSVLNTTEAAERLAVSRPTIYDWIEKKILLAWRTTKRRAHIPEEQIVGPNKVVAGLPAVLAVIEDPELAWSFLSEEWPFADEVARPIDKLKAGEVDEVIGAAQGFGSVMT